MTIGVPLHDGQQEVFRSWDHARFNVLVAGRRWGKGEVAAARLVLAALGKPLHYGYIAPSYKMARRIEWPKVQRWARLFGIPFKVNKTDLLLTFATGGSIGLYGADNPDSLRGIDQGFAGVVLDEFDQFPWDGGDEMPYLWDAVIRPMLADSRGWGQLQGTPDGYAGLYAAYTKASEGQDGWVAHQFKSIDNPLLDPEEIEEARETTDPRLFAQEWEASFEAPAGTVYDDFSREANVRPCEFDPSLPLVVGMDFNIDPMSAVLCQRHGPEWWVVASVELRHAHTKRMCEWLTEWGDEHYPKGADWKSHVEVIPDPSGKARQHAMGQSDLDVLRNHGFGRIRIRHVKRESDKWNALRALILSASGKRRYFIDPSNRRLISRLEQLAPDDTDDHLTDAAAYPAHYYDMARKDKAA